MRDSLFCKCFCHYSALSKKRRWKSIRRNRIKQDKEKKKKQGWKIALGHKKCLKLAQILQQSSGTRQVCVSVFFLFWSLYETNRFHVTVGLFSNKSLRTSKCGKNISDTLTCGSYATSSRFYHIFTSRHLWSITDAWQLNDVTGNLFSLPCSTWRVLLEMFVRLFRIKRECRCSNSNGRLTDHSVISCCFKWELPASSPNSILEVNRFVSLCKIFIVIVLKKNEE